MALLEIVYGTGLWEENLPEPTRLLPAHPAADGSLHWLRKPPLDHPDNGCTVAEWHPGRRGLPDCWQPIGSRDHDSHTVEDMAEMGYVYVGPAVPPVGRQ